MGCSDMDPLSSYATLLLVLFNAVLVFRRWPRAPEKPPSWRTCLEVVDPLLSSIMCPLACDLYFAIDWILGCDVIYAVTLLAISTLLYACALIACHSLVDLVLSSSSPCLDMQSLQANHDFAQPTNPSLSLAMGSSALLNFLLTWALLPLISFSLSLREDFDQEVCQSVIVTNMMLWLVILFSAAQVGFLALCFALGLAAVIDRRAHWAKFHPAKAKTFTRYTIRGLILYTLTTLLCLLTTNFIRLMFTTCSCQGLFQLSRSLPMVLILLGLKLPCAYLRLLWPSKSDNVHDKLSVGV